MAAKYSNKLQGKRVLVIGGTSGIGFCVAEACVEFGAIVTVASSRQEKINKTIERLTTSYPDAKDHVSGHPCDLAGADVEDNLKTLFEFATKDGKLDHVVVTAGDRFGLVKIGDVTPADIQKHSRVRFVGTLLMAKLAPQYMHQTNLSSITSTGGVNSTKPGPGWSVTAGWGSAKEGMTRGLAVDLKPIRVNCVSPGAIETELWDSFGGAGSKQQIVDHYKSKSLLNTVGKPEDMAEAYLYLMRDAFVTGITLLSDGGYVLV
jgi:NAD(P)-dependent dehydrogenase (short-subunit alcohol dehydrogenase family)